MLTKSFEYKSGDSAMFFEAFHEDENVIQVDTYHTLHDQVLEDVVYHHLEGQRGVDQSKEHYQWFEQSLFMRKAAFHSSPSFMQTLL